MVALLVEHRADVNATRLNGCTPLMDACRAGEAAVVRTLCESGANTNVLDKPGGLRAERYAEQGAGQQSQQATEDPNQRWRWALGNEEEQRVWGWSANPTGVDKAHRSVDDFVACSRALGEWGSRGGYITREEIFGAIVNEVDVPSEYVVAFH